MKKLVVTLAILFTGSFASSLLFMNCSGNKAEQTEETEHHHAVGDSTIQHENMPMDSATTAYSCPMHPEITGKEGDKCSKCGMELVAVQAE